MNFRPRYLYILGIGHSWCVMSNVQYLRLQGYFKFSELWISFSCFQQSLLENATRIMIETRAQFDITKFDISYIILPVKCWKFDILARNKHA